jgi:hypothetical protein
MGGGSYAWSNGGTTATINVCPVITTTYTVTVTNSNGCTATKEQIITVNPIPTATINGANAVCAGNSTILTATGGNTYLWSTGATTASITVSPSMATSYNVTVTNAGGCSATANKTVTVNALPMVQASCAENVCLGSTLNLTALGNGDASGATFSWSGPNGFTAASQNTSIVNVTNAAAGTYIVTITNAYGCTNTASMNTSVVLCDTQVGDYVWNDANRNGVQDASESGVAGITVTLYNSANVATATTTTDAFGGYVFTYVTPGVYTVGFSTLPANYTFTTQNTGTANGSDATISTGVTSSFTIIAGTNRMDIDAGIFNATSKIGDFVWYDVDMDGLQDVGEIGVANTSVQLFNASGTLLATTTTDASGYYEFIVTGGNTYSVGFYHTGWGLTTQTNGTSNGSDANSATGRTPNFAVAIGELKTDIDAGFTTCTCSGVGSRTNTSAEPIGEPTNISRSLVSVYPNPLSSDVLTLKVFTPIEDINATITVTDLAGRTVLTQRTEIMSGSNYIKIDATNWADGTYFVRISANGIKLEAQKVARIH